MKKTADGKGARQNTTNNFSPRRKPQTKKAMSSLITVPTLQIKNGEERPITVAFYNGTITLSQQGEYDQPEEILIDWDALNHVFNEIKKHKTKAKEVLDKK